MPDPDAPDAPPPEVPEEFAAAYRQAYRRALDSGVAEEPSHVTTPVVTDRAVEAAPGSRSHVDHWRASRWFVPSVVGVVAVVLVLGAYAIGKVAADNPPAPGSGTGPGATGASAGPTSSTGANSPGGALTPISIGAISAACVAPPAQDAAGNPVTYLPTNAIDGKPDTAWRCAGTAIGQKLTIRLASAADVVEVGLIPGYAKTDPASGVDRYAENNRITEVRWTLADGVSFVQRLDADPHHRAVQFLRVPRTRTDTVELEILAVRRGTRNDTAISEIRIAAARHR